MNASSMGIECDVVVCVVLCVCGCIYFAFVAKSRIVPGTQQVLYKYWLNKSIEEKEFKLSITLFQEFR